MIEPSVARMKKRQNGISRDACGVRERRPHDRQHPRDEDRRRPVALEPAVGAIQPARAHVELRALALEQLALPEVADRVGDRRTRHVARDAGDDDPEQRQVALVDVEAGEQHRRLGSGHADDARHGRQQEDARVSEVCDQVRRKADQGLGQ